MLIRRRDGNFNCRVNFISRCKKKREAITVTCEMHVFRKRQDCSVGGYVARVCVRVDRADVSVRVHFTRTCTRASQSF